MVYSLLIYGQAKDHHTCFVCLSEGAGAFKPTLLDFYQDAP